MTIKTTHVGSLPRTKALLEANTQHANGQISTEELNSVLESEVAGVVKRQKDIGIDVVNEGEYGHIMQESVDYGAWWFYSFTRLGGIEFEEVSTLDGGGQRLSTPGNIVLTSFEDRRDRKVFAGAYADPESGIYTGGEMTEAPVFTGDITYIGEQATRTDVDLLKKNMDAYGIEDGFMPAISPGSAARIQNRRYDSEKELLDAVADALHEEYKIITDAGLTVQIDAPDLAESWDQINPEPTIADYQDWLQLRIDAINRALQGINPELVRLHICWGSWHGPHSTDIPFDAIVDQCLEVNAKEFSFEAASGRHAHEWKIWQDGKLPAGNVIVPGLVSHSTNIIEHPELVAERLIRFAEIVGPENVIASTDCGLGGRVHEEIAWAKLETLVEGTKIANKHFGL
ncbi:5-methyltetrahydropteroyltriglutamate--homocysteine methyltransferase [Trueperella bonasi]|uniref:5-methyltetrahydropteroyltriglutamate--homocysteine methyltransferase n=1 Tax=Trueperella bonasi TaxID=312286 RepID=A0ABT9NH88_9ACTO|nr:cobalamin-independent methionine synthase II family protein [Trueperella bonasi]MDP9806368.1 5-methyltetrahydropteroyltriglutamate--homocysteine methyltransferase [Trueperella bonasi]